MSSSYFGRDDDDDSVRYYDTDGNTATYGGVNALERAAKGNFGQKTGFLETAGGLVKEVFKNAEKRRERESVMDALFNKKASPFGGAGLAGRTTSLADGSLTQISPDSFEPIVFPGGGGGVSGGKSTGQRLAGAATGALSGAATGAGMGSVLGLPGAAVGAVIGGLGGLFS
jgi:hypothetical protein